MTISAVILDLDGILLDTEVVARKAWQKAADEFGFEFSEELYSKVVGRPVAECRDIFEAVLPDGVDYEQYLEQSDVLYFGEMDRNGISMVNGAAALLDWIEQSDLDAAIATSSNRDHAEFKLQKAGLAGRIDIMVTCDDVKQGKPAPDLFLLAAQLLNHPIGNCAVIEDAEAGIIGAHEAGAIPVMMPSAMQASEKARILSYAVVTSLAEALTVLQKLSKTSA